MLADWPQDHYNYRLTEVRQMLSLLDEAIADLRAAAGDGRFDLSLTAFAEPPPVAEPLIPPPTPKETIEQVLIAARVADTASERTALLETALAGLDRDAAALPAEWLATTRAATKAAVRDRAAGGSRLPVVDRPDHRPRPIARRGSPTSAASCGWSIACDRAIASSAGSVPKRSPR